MPHHIQQVSWHLYSNPEIPWDTHLKSVGTSISVRLLARQSGQWTSRVSSIHLGNLLEMQNLTPYPRSIEVYISTNWFVILMHIKVWEAPPTTFSSSFYYASCLTLPKQRRYLDIFLLDSQLNEWIITLWKSSSTPVSQTLTTYQNHTQCFKKEWYLDPAPWKSDLVGQGDLGLCIFKITNLLHPSYLQEEILKLA